jgi:hypothetical protein
MNSPEYTLEDIKDRKVDYDMSIVYGMPFIEVNLIILMILIKKYILENNFSICFERHLF